MKNLVKFIDSTFSGYQYSDGTKIFKVNFFVHDLESFYVSVVSRDWHIFDVTVDNNRCSVSLLNKHNPASSWDIPSGLTVEEFKAWLKDEVKSEAFKAVVSNMKYANEHSLGMDMYR